MEMLYDILLNAGPIGLLALYAMYSNQQNEKRIEELQEKKEEKEEQIRERWIAVVDKVQKERVNTIALNSISKLPKDMTKDEKIAVAIQILKNIGDDEKKQMSLFQEVASDEH